jgi:hypothetical protein
MGATVTTGKRAAAFKSTAGNIIYLLFEETYDKRTYPHTPEWDCYCIGSIEHALKRIFLCASSCEGGMRQNRNGYITPEGYIAGWLKELSNPMAFMDQTIILGTKDGSRYSSISENRLDDVCGVLEQYGHRNFADALMAGESIHVGLYEEAEMLAELYGRELVSSWRILRRGSVPLHGSRLPELGYQASQRHHKFSIPEFVRIPCDISDGFLKKGDDGTWRYAGWTISIVDDYVRSLWACPVDYRKRIKMLRDALKSAPILPQGAKVLIDTSVVLEGQYQQRNVTEAMEQFGGTRTENGFEITVPEDHKLLNTLEHLPTVCASWVLPEMKVTQLQRILQEIIELHSFYFRNHLKKHSQKA